jgi:CO/xanthine dehydrogenase Mo-binding subunit
MPVNPSLKNSPGLDEWLSVTSDGRIVITSGKVDIGQRISTALAVIAAEELDVDLSRIDFIRTETGLSPDEGVTSGSNSMEQSGEAVRLATATARANLLTLAAEALDVDASTLDVDDGLIQSRDTNRSMTYWELQGDKLFDIDVNLDADIKSPDAYRLVGNRVAARGIADIVGGTMVYVHDMKMPGMLHARVVRPPHSKATLNGVEDGALQRAADAGSQVVRDGSFLAVANADEYAALKGAERINAAADWNTDPGLDARDIVEQLTTNERLSMPLENGAPVEAPVPDAPDAPSNAAVTLQARFERPYHMHGSIAPSAAMALFDNGELTVWTHSQGVYVLRASMAGAMGMDEKNITIKHMPGSGCYGHNGADDVAFDAALVARAIPGKPIMLKWTRDDEHAWEPYSSAMVMDVGGSLDANGKVVAWSHETYSDTHVMRPRPGLGMSGPSRLLAARFLEKPIPPMTPPPNMQAHGGVHRNLDPLYTFANKHLVKHLVRNLPLRTSAMRTLGGYANVFAIESFMDEMAEAGNLDPLEFRLRNLDDERAKAVLSAMSEKLNATPLPEGRGRGIGFGQYKNEKTYAAVGVELSVNDAAEVRLHRTVIAADAGQVVDPDGLAAQMEGGFLQAASWTLFEAVKFDRDGITSRDWDDYPILRFDNIPEIETILMDRPGDPYLGAGEAVSGPTAGAIANAIYMASGQRLRRLPFTPDAIREAALR